MIYGHSSGYPWDLSQFTKIFRTINETNIGDRVYVTYKGALYVYQITAKKSVPAKDTAAFEPDEQGEQLVLYTCWPPDSVTNRYLVYATPVEKVALK
jgi:LPXTG-site transpeptidase (sortase) family protein